MLKFGIQEVSYLNINETMVNSVIRISPLENFVSTVQNVFTTDGSTIIRNQTQNLQFCSTLYIESEDLIVGMSGLHSELSVLNYRTNEVLVEHYRTNQNSGVFHMIYSPYSQSLITIGQGVKVFNFVITKVSSFKKSVKISLRSSFADYFDTSLLCKPPFDENLQLLYLPSPKNTGIVAYDLDGKIVRTVTKMKLPSPFAFDFCPGTGKILASDEFSGSSLVLWDPSSSIEARFSFTALSSISINYIKFLNKENAVFVTSNGGIFVLNVKTGQYIHCYTPPETPLRIFYLGNDEEIRKSFLRKINPKKYQNEQNSDQKPIKGGDICGEYGLALCFKTKIVFYRITIPWRLFSKNLLKPIFLERCSKPNSAARIMVLASNSFIRIISPRTGKMLNVASPAASEHPSQIVYDRVYLTNTIHKPTEKQIKLTQAPINSNEIPLNSNQTTNSNNTENNNRINQNSDQSNQTNGQSNQNNVQSNQSNVQSNQNNAQLNQSQLNLNIGNQSNNQNNKITLNKSSLSEIFRQFSFSNNKINKMPSIENMFLNKKISKVESTLNQIQLNPLFPNDINNTAEIIFVVLENGSMCIFNADNYPCRHLSTLNDMKVKFFEKVSVDSYIIMNFRSELFLVNFNDNFASMNICKSFKFGGSGNELLSHLFSIEYNKLVIIFTKKIFLFDLKSFKVMHSTDQVIGSSVVGIRQNYIFLGYQSGKIGILRFTDSCFVKVMNNDTDSEKFHSASICGFSFSSKYWISASIDGLIIIWDYVSFLNVRRIELNLPIYSVAFLNGKLDIIVGTENEIMKIDGKRAFNSENGDEFDPEIEILDNYDKKTDFLEMQRQMERDKKKRQLAIERGEIDPPPESEKNQKKKGRQTKRFHSKKLWFENNKIDTPEFEPPLIEADNTKEETKMKTIGMEEIEKLLNGDQNSQQNETNQSNNNNENKKEIEKNENSAEIETNENNNEEDKDKEKKKSNTKKKKKVRKSSTKALSNEIDQLISNENDNFSLNENGDGNDQFSVNHLHSDENGNCNTTLNENDNSNLQSNEYDSSNLLYNENDNNNLQSNSNDKSNENDNSNSALNDKDKLNENDDNLSAKGILSSDGKVDEEGGNNLVNENDNSGSHDKQKKNNCVSDETGNSSNEGGFSNSNENHNEITVKLPQTNKNESSPQRFKHNQKKNDQMNTKSDNQITTQNHHNQSSNDLTKSQDETSKTKNEKNKNKKKHEGRLEKLALSPKKTEPVQQPISNPKPHTNKSLDLFERLYKNKKQRCSTPPPSKPTTPFQEMGIDDTEDFLNSQFKTKVDKNNVKLDPQFSDSNESKPTVITKLMINLKNKGGSNKKPLIMNDNKVYQFSGNSQSNIGFQIHSFASKHNLLMDTNDLVDGNLKITLDTAPQNEQMNFKVVRRSLDMKPSLINQSPRKIVIPKTKVNASYSHQRNSGFSKLHLLGS